MLDLLKHSAYCLKKTKAAKKYIEDNHLVIPDTIQDTFEGRHSEDGLSNTPNLNLAISLNPYIREAKLQILKKCSVSPMSRYILKESADEIREISQVILVHSSDDGASVPVINRFHLKEDSSKASDIIKYIQIPTKKELEEINPNIVVPLGCYLSNTGVILIWVDRVFSDTICGNGYLLFQKVLLHELIHALLDCADRNVNGVLLNKSKERSNFEETLDNLLVLKCYEMSDEKAFGSIKRFVESQPSEYRKSIDLYNMSNDLGWGTKEVVSIISSLLYFKTLPNQNANSRHISLYSVMCIDDDDSENDFDVIDFTKSAVWELNGHFNTTKKEDIEYEFNEHNGAYYYVFHTKYRFTNLCGKKIILTKVIISLTVDDTLFNEAICTFHFKNTNRTATYIMTYKFGNENGFIDNIIDNSLILCQEKFYGELIEELIRILNSKTDHTKYDFYREYIMDD